MGINIGIVIGCNNPAYENRVKVRIPALHGVPLVKSIYKKMLSDYGNYLGASSNGITLVMKNSLQSDYYNYDINNFNSSENGRVINDDDIPWYPICYPFGTNKGPNLYDLVYVLDDSYVIGWTGKMFIPTKS